MLIISKSIFIPLDEIEITAIRAQGAGGQNVNKVSSAIHLRFDINASSLSLALKEALLKSNDKRITKEGVIVIKAQTHRTQDKNKKDALKRLTSIIKEVTISKKKRIPTRATKSSKRKRVEQKVKRGQTKALRGRVQKND